MISEPNQQGERIKKKFSRFVCIKCLKEIAPKITEETIPNIGVIDGGLFSYDKYIYSCPICDKIFGTVSIGRIPE